MYKGENDHFFKAHSSPNKILYLRYISLQSEIVNITSNNIVDF